MNEKELKKGTTTVGIVCDKGVVMASERRATMGTLIAHKTTRKLFKIDDHMGMTVAGLVGDSQVLVRWLTAETEIYRLKHDEGMTIKAAATLMANILNGRKFYPFWVQLLIGGIDDRGPQVYSLDAAGGSIPDDYVTTGSGSPYVYGVLEDHYRKGISIEKGINLAIRGIHAAMKRDAASGNGIEVATITKKAFKRLTDKEIGERIEAMELQD
ncbi:MAG: archaeal proteasome endopeptidase complex subunit beta [Thermoplasmata archaeon]|nr:archaeal proteasome endopeptidase complex subunit beta [Thermoplasmata archaeon]